VGLDDDVSRTSLDALVQSRHLGGVVLLGGWYDGSARVRATTGHLAALAGDTTGGLGLFVAADQEGGNVQQLRGAGFTRIPTALAQGQLSPTQLTAAATTWAREMLQAGVNVNLAPVADTVPTSIGRANQPIGRWDRQYSSDPATVARQAVAFITGMHAGGVAATIKHFPGLGRITGNTDVTASGITDGTTTTTDPYLTPFAAGSREGVEFVLVGSAIYSRIDPGVNAVFSATVITGLLRTKMGYDGVVIADDVGAATAVAAVPVAERATRFVAAGGDIVLTARPSTVLAMHNALVSRMRGDAGFAAKVEAATTRVVTTKITMGLAGCS
jgi:beta-N-acetylhexosaminidase